MSGNQIKIFVIAVLTLSLFALAGLKTDRVRALSSLDDDVAVVYKTKCSLCHTPKVAKFFDEKKADDVLVETVMKGKKGEKPPYMPSFETKGMTLEQAKLLVAFMKETKKQNEANANPNSNPNK